MHTRTKEKVDERVIKREGGNRDGEPRGGNAKERVKMSLIPHVVTVICLYHTRYTDNQNEHKDSRLPTNV
jgi:hypothetical protein